MSPAALALLAALLSAPGPARPTRPRTVTILYLADLNGQLEPCGCSQDQRGGLPRLAAAVARIRKENPNTVLIGGGDLLFETADLPRERREADLVKAKAIASVLRRAGLAFSAAGERDAAAGEAAFRRSGLPFARARRVGDVAAGLLREVPRAPVRVGIVHQGGLPPALAAAEEARARGLHLLLAAHRDSLDDDVNRAVLGAPVPVVQVQGRGQSLARIDFRLAGDLSRGFQVLEGPAQRAEEIDSAEVRLLEYRRRLDAARAGGSEELAAALAARIAELEGRLGELRRSPVAPPPADRPSISVSFVPLGADLPEDRAARRILTRAYAALARLNLAAAAGRPCPAPPPAENAYAGAAACQSCHPAASAQWSETAHARAYQTLARGARQFDLDCIACHVTGWKEPGGACSVAQVTGREGVQCESCHGPAGRHAAEPPGHVVREPPEERCRACHTAEHSTRFEPSSYRKRVLGPGHGMRP